MFTPKQEKADPSNDTVQNNKSMVVIPYVYSLSLKSTNATVHQRP